MVPGQHPIETGDRLRIGSIIAETYEIRRLLGRGGMGSVWEASHARLPGKRVAIKVLHPQVARDQESLARFRREAEIASRIGHPNIVDVHDFNQLADGTPYLILEYLEGVSLDDQMASGTIPLKEVLSIVRQIGSGLRAAHREGVIHRDLKPQNIFLAQTTDADGNATARARILDFGISKIRGSTTVQTQDSTILGTPQYMAPEQATGNHAAVDQRTDVFALGSIVYEMLASKPAFTGQTIPEVVFKVVYEQPEPLEGLCAAPPHVIAAVHKALAKEQEDRFQTVESFVEALSGTRLSVNVASPNVASPNVASPNVASPNVVSPNPLGLASTIASGNHPAVTGFPAKSSSIVGSDTEIGAVGIAATIDSGRMSASSLDLGLGHSQHSQTANSMNPVGSAETVGLVVPAVGMPVEAGAPSSSRGLKMALTLAVIVALGGAGVAYWALSRSRSEVVSDRPNNELLSAAEQSKSPDSERDPESRQKPTLKTQKDENPVVKEATVKEATTDSKNLPGGSAKERAAKERAAKERAAKERAAKERAAKERAAKKQDTPAVDDPSGNSSDADRVKAKELLAQAKSIVHSDPDGAIRILRHAAGIGGRGSAYELVRVMAHCRNRDLSPARTALRKLRGRSRRRAIKFCTKLGFEID